MNADPYPTRNQSSIEQPVAEWMLDIAEAMRLGDISEAVRLIRAHVDTEPDDLTHDYLMLQWLKKQYAADKNAQDRISDAMKFIELKSEASDHSLISAKMSFEPELNSDGTVFNLKFTEPQPVETKASSRLGRLARRLFGQQ